MSDSEQDDNTEPDAGRRGALGTLVIAGSALYAAALAVPAGRLLTSTATTGGAGGFRRLIRLAHLAEGTPMRVRVTGDHRDAFTVAKDQVLGSLWLRRQGDQVIALGTECPHLGCAIALGDGGFACPCHASGFDLEGRVLSGPSPRPMDVLEARVVDGWVEVDFRRYRQGTSDKIEVA